MISFFFTERVCLKTALFLHVFFFPNSSNAPGKKQLQTSLTSPQFIPFGILAVVLILSGAFWNLLDTWFFVFNLLNLNCSWEDGVLKFLFLSVFKLLQFWPVGPSSMFKIHFWVFLNCSFLVYVAIGYNKICLAYYMESVIPWRILDSFLLGNNISRLQDWE